MLDNKKISAVLALGYFDSVHLGHQAVISKAKELAEKLNAKTVVVTFDGNLRAILGDGTSKSVFSAKERETFFKDLGADEVFFAPSTKEFLGMKKQEFLDFLNQKYLVRAYVSGEDYKFGKNGSGTVLDLNNYAKNNGQECITLSLLKEGNLRISTTVIKELLSEGNVSKANELLGRAYSVTGTVFADRKVGSTLGFPTVNIEIEKDKHQLKNGVYGGRVTLEKKEYLAIINYGARPTFSLDKKLIEAHFVGFNGMLYGKQITIEFDFFMRDIKRFDSVQELKKQLEIDKETVKEYNR